MRENLAKQKLSTRKIEQEKQRNAMSKSPCLRRIQADIRELALDPSDMYHAAPLEGNMLEWHFTIRGADHTDFAGGIYHGRILLPPDYPFKPPHILFLTPSGRFETHTKICLSFSAFHPELWQPAWGVRLILEALISFLPTPADGALGALDWSSAERKRLAERSVTFVCPTCQCCVKDLLPKLQQAETLTAAAATTANKSKQRFQKEIAELQRWQVQEHPKDSKDDDDSGTKKEEDSSSKQGKVDMADDDKTKPKEEDLKVTDGGEVYANKSSAAAQAAANQTAEPPPSPPSLLVVEEKPSQSEETIEAKPAAAATPTPPAAAILQNSNSNNNNTPPPPPPQPPHKALDVVLHATIVVLAILCGLLLRKIQALVVDLRALTPMSSSP